MEYTDDPELVSIYADPGLLNVEFSFSFWYHEYTEVYINAPRLFLEKEIELLDKLKIKMGRRYWPRLVAQSFAANDVYHQYYDGRKRDPEKDATVSRGPMYTGQGRKDTGQRLGHPCESDEPATGGGATRLLVCHTRKARPTSRSGFRYGGK